MRMSGAILEPKQINIAARSAKLPPISERMDVSEICYNSYEIVVSIQKISGF